MSPLSTIPPRARRHPVARTVRGLAAAYRSLAGPRSYGKRYMHRMACSRSNRTLRSVLHG